MISIAPSDGAWPTIDVLAVPERKTVKNRLHFDLRAVGVATSQELERLLSLGARRVDVGQQPDVSWAVLRPRGQRVLPALTVGSGGLALRPIVSRERWIAGQVSLRPRPSLRNACRIPHSCPLPGRGWVLARPAVDATKGEWLLIWHVLTTSR